MIFTITLNSTSLNSNSRNLQLFSLAQYYNVIIEIKPKTNYIYFSNDGPSDLKTIGSTDFGIMDSHIIELYFGKISLSDKCCFGKPNCPPHSVSDVSEASEGMTLTNPDPN